MARGERSESNPNRQVYKEAWWKRAQPVQAPGTFDTTEMKKGQRIYTSTTGSYTERKAGQPGSSSGGWSYGESEEDARARRNRQNGGG